MYFHLDLNESNCNIILLYQGMTTISFSGLSLTRWTSKREWNGGPRTFISAFSQIAFFVQFLAMTEFFLHPLS